MTDEPEKLVISIEARIADFERNFRAALRKAIADVACEFIEELEQSITVEAKSE